jgi:exodeoxyribonuclease V alpha subunit
LYLERYWRDEGRVCDDLLARSRSAPIKVDEVLLAHGLARLFPDDREGCQATAAARSLQRLLSVVAGGPGTGKTTTVARILALLEEQALAVGGPPLLVGLAAPTGKAAARMVEAVHNEANRLDVSASVRGRLLRTEASTVHRLLGRHPAGLNRFRHDARNQLPHDVVVVDETSMMSLPLMARLVEAVRPDARLVLVGDPQQLASVEAGAVLADIVGPATSGAAEVPAAEVPAAAVPAAEVPAAEVPAAAPPVSPVSSCITVLFANHRFSGPLAELAGSVRAGDSDGVVAVLASASSSVRWLDLDAATASSSALEAVRLGLTAMGLTLFEAANRGDGAAALEALGQFRLLCAHRHGPVGADTWNLRGAQWMADIVGPGAGAEWYLGRPVVVTENDYGLNLFNGDAGVTIRREEGGLAVAFRSGASVRQVSCARLEALDTAFAMTAHRAQGSEFEDVVVLLPDASSRVLTREMLYTAVTRARRKVTVVGTEASVREAVARPVARASGLAARLWGPPASHARVHVAPH